MVFSQHSKLQTIRFGILLLASFVVCILWASAAPLMIQHQSNNPVILGHYELDYFVLLSSYLFSIAVFVLGAGYFLFALLKNKHQLQSKKRLFVFVALWWVFAIVLYFTPIDTLRFLKYRGINIAILITLIFPYLLLDHNLWNNKYWRIITIIYSIVFIGYIVLEVSAYFFISQQPRIAGYVALHQPVESSKGGLVTECLSGCIDRPAWGAYVDWADTYINSVVRWVSPGRYDVIHEYNNMGLRGPDTTYESDKFRILIFGDSYVYGHHVDNEHTIGLQLQSVLDELADNTSSEYEVLQFGVNYGFVVPAYQFYHNEGYKFEPDLVLYMYTANDFTDVNGPYFYPERQSVFYEISDGEIHSYKTPPVLPEVVHDGIKNIGRRLYVWHVRTPLTTLMVAVPLVDRILGGEIFFEPDDDWTYEDSVADVGIVKAAELTQDIFSLWQQQLQAASTDLAIVNLARPETYMTGEVIEDVDRINFEIVDSLGIPIIDTLHPFHTLILNGIDIDDYAEHNDIHFNPQGYYELAVVIFDWLVEQDIVEETSPTPIN
ncbi:hypothetical protein ACFLYO_09405 [Chloroflexota bacterium]